jgi:branched-chain amino acid transport system ATP-binding protein
MSSKAAMLSATGLRKSFGAVTAASDVNVEVAAGERVSLIGSNGAGKTTFINMITGYIRPDAGSIQLDGREITGHAPRQITRMGVARSFQIPQLCDELTVLENMLVAAACGKTPLSWIAPARSGQALVRAQALLERFGLAQHARRPVSELPGGVRKLLDIAMALTVQPKLLLLDEPTSGVSAEEKFPMMQTIIEAIADEPVAVLFVEHDMEIVEHYANRVIAFYSGRIIADDVPARALATEDVRRYVTGQIPPDAASQ